MYTYKHGLVKYSQTLSIRTLRGPYKMVSILSEENLEKRYNCKGILLSGKKKTVQENEVFILCCCT